MASKAGHFLYFSKSNTLSAQKLIRYGDDGEKDHRTHKNGYRGRHGVCLAIVGNKSDAVLAIKPWVWCVGHVWQICFNFTVLWSSDDAKSDFVTIGVHATQYEMDSTPNAGVNHLVTRGWRVVGVIEL